MQFSQARKSPLIVPVTSGSVPMTWKIDFLLRLGIFGCFVGHGFWGIVQKAAWVPLFEAIHISGVQAYELMPWIGAMDIVVGITAFLIPTRSLLVWASFWTLFTAFLRPLAGMGMSEFFERAGNYGVPLCMLYIYGLPSKNRGWFSELKIADSFSPINLQRIEKILRWSLFMLLAGHCGLAFFVQHQNLVHHFTFLGIPADVSALKIFGLAEMALALLVLVKPRLYGLMLFVLLYKIACELMYPISGQLRDSMETFERLGDYVIPAALWLIYSSEKSKAKLSAG